MNKIKKTVLNLTHMDSDGSLCAICLKNTFDKVKSIPTGYGRLDAIINNMGTHLLKDDYDALYITDLNLTIVQYNEIKRVADKLKVPVTYLDHHSSNIDEMHNPKEHRLVYVENCAGTLTKNYLQNKYKIDLSHLNSLSKYINDYDIWIKKYPMSDALNYLFAKYSFNGFTKRFENGLTKFNKEEKEYITQRVNNIKDAWDNLDIQDIENARVSVIFITNNETINEMCDKTLKLDDIEVVMAVYYNKSATAAVSMRTNNDNINFADVFTNDSLVAGHKQAMGSKNKKMNNDELWDFINNVSRRLITKYKNILIK